MALIGYTGFAFVKKRQKQPDDQVDEWIMETLFYRRSVAQIMDALATEAPVWVDAMPGPWRAQAFSLIGWAPQSDGCHLPFAGLVSNFHNAQGQPLGASTPTFTSLRSLPTPKPWFVSQVGVSLTTSEVRWMRRGLNRLTTQSAGPDRVADLLVQTLRQVADRASNLVGRAAMVSCLPRPPGRASGAFLTNRRGRPSLDTPTFFYQGDGPDSVRVFGPLTVCGESGMSEVSLEYLNESESDVLFKSRLRRPKFRDLVVGDAQLPPVSEAAD